MSSIITEQDATIGILSSGNRLQHTFLILLCAATLTRSRTIIEGGGYRHEKRVATSKYIYLHLVKGPE